jgi:hypothetical protein
LPTDPLRRASIKEQAGQHTKRGKGVRIPPEKRKMWRRFFNDKQTPVETFISGLKVKTDIIADDDKPVWVDFLLRPKQKDLLDEIVQAWREGRSARVIILKGRRQGCSIFLCALWLERILRVPGFEAMLVAQDSDTATYFMEKIQEFFEQIPEEALIANGITVLNVTKGELRLQHGKYKVSQIRVVTARRRALGRGRGNNAIAATEFPVWPEEARADLSGVLPTCRDVPGNIVVFESTARGYDEFRDRYYAAKKGESGYTAMFFAAQDHPDARRPFETNHERDRFIESLGTLPEYGGQEELEWYKVVREQMPALDALEFMNWLRFVLMDECGGSIDLRKREYPVVEEDAFQGTGRPVFPLQYVRSHLSLAEAREKEATKATTHLSDTTRQCEVTEDRHGAWTIFEMPEEGEAYTFGCDVASGYERQSDGKKMADWSVIIVKHVLTCRTVARFRDHIFPSDLGREVFKASVLYGNCRGYVERNMDGGTVISAMEELEFNGFFGWASLLTIPRVVRSADGRKSIEREAGFRTSVKTKPKLVDCVMEHLRHHSPPAKATPFDIQTLHEMSRFERDEKGKMSAATGFDDCVMAEGIALMACRELVQEVSVLPKVEGVVMPTRWPRGIFAFLTAATRYLNALADEKERALKPPEPVEPTELEKLIHGFREWASLHWKNDYDAGARRDEVEFALEAFMSEEPLVSHGITKAQAIQMLQRHDVPRSLYRR